MLGENDEPRRKMQKENSTVQLRKFTYSSLKNNAYLYPHICSSLVKVPNVIVLVGLPARGKTFISKKLCRYLNWIGIKTKAFNLGDYRRWICNKYDGAAFFHPQNTESVALRGECARLAMDDMVNYLRSAEGDVTIFDATNSTRERRQFILDCCVKDNLFRVFFVESICNDPTVIEANIQDVKVNSPDYQGMDKDIATEDFVRRIEMYKKTYQQIDDELDTDLSYIKIINAGKSFYVHNVQGHVQSRVVYFLMNIHLLPRSIYLTRVILQGVILKLRDNLCQGKIAILLKVLRVTKHRGLYQLWGVESEKEIKFYIKAYSLGQNGNYLKKHGESEYNIMGRLGGDSPLTAAGISYARELRKFFASEKVEGLRVWSSQKIRAVMTSSGLQGCASYVEYWKTLEEIDAGICEGLTYAEIADRYPQQLSNRDADKYHYRYPSGESYEDLVARLEPVIMELERQSNVLVVSHQAVLRCILAYFLDKGRDELPYLKVPLHSVVKLKPVAYGCQMQIIKFDVDAVDTHRDKPSDVSANRTRAAALSTLPVINKTT